MSAPETARRRTPDLLDAIIAATRARVEAAIERESRSLLERRAATRQPNGAAFRERLSRAGSINVIAECKRRSPSRGVLRVAYAPVALAAGYERAGAAAISVLTEPERCDVRSEAELLEVLRPGLDGVILQAGARRTTFLPAVWEQLPDARQFIRHLKLKAGWPADFWPSDMQVWLYTTESFG